MGYKGIVQAEPTMTSRCRNEHGLTLIEMMIAIFVIAIVMMAMAATAIAAQRSMQTSERVVLATQLGNEILEGYLARDFEDLGLYTDDVATAFGAGATTYDGDALVVFPQPTTPDYDRVPQALQTFPDQDGVAYEARTAIMWTADQDPSVTDQFKRIVVELSWDARGEVRTSTVAALVARNPAEQMLTVVVEPDTVAISDTGTQHEDFTISVTAKDPQSTVVVRWEDRSGADQVRNLVDVGGGLLWEADFAGQQFANGGTLFTVVGRLAGTTQTDVTTIGRALFLQPLEMPPSLLTVTPSVLSYHVPSASYCESSVVVEAVAHGAIFSDPMLLIVDGVEYPMEAVDPPLTEGTLFRKQLDLVELGIQDGDTAVPVAFRVTRPTGLAVPVEATLDIPIQVLTDSVDAEGNLVSASCPS